MTARPTTPARTSHARPPAGARAALGATLAALAVFAAAPRGAAAQEAVRDLAGFRTGTLQANDDGSTGLDNGAGRVNFGFANALNFFGSSYAGAYVNTNGNLTFGAPLRIYTPFGLTTTLGTPIIAPFFADVDTRGTGGRGSVNGGGNSGNVAQAFAGSGLVTYGTATVDGRAAFGIDYFSNCAAWTGAGPGPACADFASSGGLAGVGYFADAVNKRNIFQVLLIDRSDVRAGDFDIEYNYNQVQWETGSARESGGTNGLGGFSARVGFSNGTGAAGSFFELAGSGVNGAFLDGGPAGTSLAANSLGSDVRGRYVFEVRNGIPVITATPEPGTLALAAGGLLALAAAARRRRVC